MAILPNEAIQHMMEHAGSVLHNIYAPREEILLQKILIRAVRARTINRCSCRDGTPPIKCGTGGAIDESAFRRQTSGAYITGPGLKVQSTQPDLAHTSMCDNEK